MKMMKLMSFLVSLIAFIFCCTSVAATGDQVYNVVSLGAKPDGITDSTRSFLNAWFAACGSVRPATIYVPKGRYLLNHAIFRGKCKNAAITIRVDGTLVAPSDYRVLEKPGNWLMFEGVSGVSIVGGNFDGKGTALWACKAARKNCPAGASTLTFTNSNNIVVDGLTSINSQMFHIVINGCQNVKMRGVKIITPGDSPNTDGIHVQLSTGVTITNTAIKTGDDCVSIGPGTRNLWIERITCGPGHGISIGSLAKDPEEAGVQNVTVKTSEFVGTQNGLRIKSWGRPSSGFVKDVVFQNAVMKNVQSPIVIDQNYCPRNENCPGQVSGVRISGVTYQDIRGTSATKVAVKFDCSARNPCRGISLQNVKLTYGNKPAQSSCVNADGKAYGLVLPSSCL